MRFDEKLRTYIMRYRDDIHQEYWFEYKSLIKRIASMLRKYSDIDQYVCQDKSEDCCICLENGKLMRTFCCHNHIHHKCLIDSIISVSEKCPICRKDCLQFFDSSTYHTKSLEEQFNLDILSIISLIYLNILRIEKYINHNMPNNDPLTQKYSHINYIAIQKICEKIETFLHINVQDLLKHNSPIMPL
jgi:hypothetical protein